MSDDSQSLYERIGGQPTIDRLIEEFYGRVLTDPELYPFFQHAAMDALKRMQREFFAAALGGPIEYSGQELSYVHQGRGIRVAHFTRFCDHLVDTLQAIGIDEADSREIRTRIETYVDDITGAAGGTDG